MTTDSHHRRQAVLDEIMGYLLDASESGKTPDLEEIQHKFPYISEDAGLATEVEALLSTHRWLRPQPDQEPLIAPHAAPELGPDHERNLPERWGDYLLLEELGRGGMGEVYKACEISTGKIIALKRLQDHMLEDEAALRRFRDEPRHMQGVDHKGVVHVLEVGEHDGCPYFTMEMIDGVNLSVLARNQAFPDRKIAELMRGIADAVAFAHESGILHRDLKPANVLLTRDLQPKVADFGLAKNLKEESDLTRSLILGTLNYMSPEQAKGEAPTVLADVYGLGAILYELLTARPPFRGETPPQILLRVQTEDIRPPRQISPEADARLEAICLKCMEKDGRRRYQTAAEVVDEFDRVLQGRKQLAPRNTWPRRLLKQARRHPARASLLAVLFIATVLVVGLYRQASQTKAARREQAATVHMQQGNWSEAIGEYGAAMQSGHPDTAGLRFQRAKCLIMLGEGEAADDEFAALLADGETPESLRTEVKIWRGSALLVREPDAAIKLLHEARNSDEVGGPAEMEYLEGLLASDFNSAAEHFAAAVRHEPHHVQARRMLAVSLFFSARLPEFHRQTEICLAFAPNDVYLELLLAVCHLLEGNEPDALEILTRYQDDHMEVATAIRSMIPVVTSLHDSDPNSAVASFPVIESALKQLTSNSDSGGKTYRGSPIPLPPTIHATLRRLGEETRAAYSTRNPQAIVAALERIAAFYPDGTLLYALGRLYVGWGQHAKAEQAFHAAERKPSLLNVRPYAQFWLMRLKSHFSTVQKDQKDQYLEEAVTCVRALVNEGQIPKLTAADLHQMCEVALAGGDFSLARHVAEIWQERYPEDPNAHEMLGVTALKKKNFCAALSHFERAESMGSTDERLASYIQSTRSDLRNRASEIESEDGSD